MPDSKFGPYLVQKKIGSGSFASVYRVRREDADGEAALKILQSSVSSLPGVKERFERHLCSAAQLCHPYVVPVRAFGELNGRLYVEMPYLMRGSLAQRFRQPGEMAAQEAIRLLRNVGSALDYARGQGVVHGDLRLENILLDDRGGALLADFGLAGLIDDTRLIVTGTRPLYAAPERARGEGFDHCADLYALAVCAYALIIGRFPFAGQDAVDVLHQQNSAGLPLPSRVDSRLPTALDRVMQRALAKSPGERYLSADMFLEALARSLADEPAHVVCVNLWEHTTTAAPVIKKLTPTPPASGDSVRTADEWVQAALAAGERRDEAIACLKRALAVEPLHSQANRLLSRLENAKPLPQAAPASVVQSVAVEPLKKVKRAPSKNRKWTYVAVGGAILLNLTAVLFVLSVLGNRQLSSLNGLLDQLQGTPGPVLDISGTPASNVPNLVLTVPPVRSKPLRSDTPVSDVLDVGRSHEYTFDAAAGREYAIGIQFFSPTAQGVSKNVAVLRPDGSNAGPACQRDAILSGDSGAAFICLIDRSGQWKVRVFGVDGQSTGAYVISVIPM